MKKPNKLVKWCILLCIPVVYLLFNWNPDPADPTDDVRAAENLYDNNVNCLVKYTIQGELHNSLTSFFVETGEATHLTPRQACAVEAAATIQRPNRVLVYMKNLDFDKLLLNNPWLKHFDNIDVISLDLSYLFCGTPMERIYESSKFRTGEFVTEHTADLARIALSKKFGGMYLDLDMILIKPIFEIGYFVLKDLGNPIMHFQKDGTLINYIYNSYQDINYNPDVWTGVGQDVISKSVKEVCGLSLFWSNYDQAMKECNVTSLDPKLVSPVKWNEWENFFNKEEDLEKFRSEAFAEAYAIHVANKMTRSIEVHKNSSGVYNQIAKKYCPVAYRTFPEKF